MSVVRYKNFAIDFSKQLKPFGILVANNLNTGVAFIILLLNMYIH